MDNFRISSCGYYPRYNCEIEVVSAQYELQYVASGGVFLEYNDKRLELEGSCCWINLPGVKYRYRPMEKYGCWEHRFVVFHGDIDEYWCCQELIPDSPCKVPGHYDFAARLDRIIELSHIMQHPLNRLETINLLEKILIDLKRLQDKNILEPSWLGGVLTAINARNNASPDYDTIAGRFGMTRRSLFRNFKKATGTSPHMYHLKTKISLATELLETSSMAIKEIADALNYSDVYYFTKQFTAFTGTSPGALRKSNQRIMRLVAEDQSSAAMDRYT